MRRFGSVAGIYEHLDEIGNPGARNRLIAGREDAFRCLDLATLRRGAPLSPAFDPDAGRVGGHDPERMAAWLGALGLDDVVRLAESVAHARP